MLLFVLIIGLIVAVFVTRLAFRAEDASLEEGILLAVATLSWFVTVGAFAELLW